ncbi:MAG TPA: hypothetical protein VI731_12130 [Bacteroidia bacterium]|nr:hypothetical protein [Bacteroidia bacterium]
MKTMLHVKRTMALLLILILNFVATGQLFSQNDGIDIKVDLDPADNPPAWYSAWWVWVVGLAVFVIIIVAIISAGKKR